MKRQELTFRYDTLKYTFKGRLLSSGQRTVYLSTLLLKERDLGPFTNIILTDLKTLSESYCKGEEGLYGIFNKQWGF
jgi:hypothetical protein